jgi:hypothetical protein
MNGKGFEPTTTASLKRKVSQTSPSQDGVEKRASFARFWRAFCNGVVW